VGITNVTTQVADAHELPFADETFDRLTCRFAAMYFADYDMAFREALRVLKPGGMAVYLVWGGFDQPLFRDVFGTLFQYVQPPEDEPGAPSPFTFAQPGTLTQALEAAGFAQVSEDSTTIPTAFRGAPQRWWEWLVDMAPPFQPLVASLSDDDRQQALSEIYAVVGRYHDGSGVNVPIDVNIAWGSKPESR
jgi:SAM-dependent methyltransferase